MKKISEIQKTERITTLREYYLNNSPVSVNPICNQSPGIEHRALMNYIEGWVLNEDAETVRIRRSKAEAYILEQSEAIIDPDEILVGQRDYRDFSPEEEKKYYEYLKIKHIMPDFRGRADHLAMDYTLLLEKGVNGILEILDEKIANIDLNDGKATQHYEYYYCCKLEMEAFKSLCIKYEKEAKRLYDEAPASKKDELKALYETLCQVPLNPARTFREALQSINLFTRTLYGIYSFGKPDQFLISYYKRDIENGILTPEEAQELVDSFFLHSIPSMPSWAAEGFMLGGRDYDGKLVENELTWHFLNGIRHTHIPDPNVGFCVTDETSEEILEFVSELITEGHCQPQIWNSNNVFKGMKSYGFDDSAAHMFTLSTCVENTPIGCSGISITSPYINTLGVFLKAFEKCDNNSDFEEIFSAFENELRSYCNQAILQENLWQLERARNSHDPMRISVLIHDCLERGLSHECGGARYNHLEPNMLGMLNVSECFNVIYKLVFEEQYITIDEFKKALSANYEGYESLLNKIRLKTRHFGTDDEKSNEIAKRVADVVLKIFGEKTTVRGAKICPGAFSYRDHELHGRVTGASPDGRKKGMPLNDASSPVQGYDNCGPTASINSTSSWEPYRFIGGTSVNMKINSQVKPEIVTSLIKSYMKTNGSQLQFNIVDTKTLLDAQLHPENYGDLLVRIGGYSDFFVKLPVELQNDVISRSQNEM